MYASSEAGTPITASAYYELPVGGPWSLVLTWNNVGSFVVAQGAAAPAPGELLAQTVAPDAVGAYSLTEPFVQLQWTADGPFAADTTTAFYIFCLGEVPPDQNRPPDVDAGPDREIFLTGSDPVVITLDGTATDDGLPSGTLNLLWERRQGPDTLTFADATLEDPTVTLTEPGVYLLRLTGDDGELSARDTMQITVHSPVDLTVNAVDISSMSVDPGTLTVSGMVTATIANLGSGAANGPFTLTIFEDRNANGTYEPELDNHLGDSQVAELDAGVTTPVSVPVSGTVLFTGNRVYAFVDSQDTVLESDETNNYNHTGGECIPSEPGVFSPTLEWQWTSSSTLSSYRQVMMSPAVVDLNDDGIPDIVFSTFAGGDYTSNGHLRAISGNGGSELFTVTDAAYDVRGAASVAVGDIDLDGRPEILVGDESGSRLLAFEHDGTYKWRSPTITGTVNWGAAALADLDHDGTPEIIIGATVLNADGTVRWAGAYGTGNGGAGPLSLAADLDMSGEMEVVAGNTAYRADGSVYWNNTAVPNGFNAIGDIDSDGFPEVVVVGGGALYLLEHDGTLKWGPVSISGGGGGAPTVADVDADGVPEIGVAGNSRYTVFEGDGTVKWIVVTQDASSRMTGSSVFDFEGDGSVEVVYGDERYLRVYRGLDGVVLWQTASSSGTTYELPVIVDVDADGNAEIVKVSNNYSGGGQYGVQVYGDANDQWVPTREIWNQHTYHITNVNADGSIPTNEANNWEIYNNYRQNIYTLACASARPDLTASYVRRADSAAGITLTARIGNGGGVFVPPGVYVSFYSGDPAAGGTLLGTTTTSIRLNPGDYQDVSLVVPFDTAANPVWVVADDQGGLHGLHTELDEVNNLHASVVILEPLAYRTYTLDADFDDGAYQHVDHAAQPDELHLQGIPDRFDFLWVAVSSKGTVVKINVHTGAVVGEYWTSPNGQPKNPSRTTVDNNGSIWVANRDGNSVTHIGLLENNECEDRNDDGVIQTSTGLGDPLLWTNAGDADTNGGVSTAEDECIIHYVRVSSSGTRHVSVNQDNNVWVSGTGNRIFNLIDGETGQILRTEGSVGYGGYGGLIDGNGVIWSSRNLLRWDTALPLMGSNGTNWMGYEHDSYGLCIDSQGNVWNTSLENNRISKFAPDGTLLGTYAHGEHYAQGCVVDYNDHVWVAHSLYRDSVGHLLPDGTLVGNVTVGSGPTGVAVDVNGKIWATNYNSGTVSRIDPTAGPIGGGGVPVGAVDFTTVNLGGNLYNYSDMTGSTLSKLPEEGHWEVVFDSAIPDAAWGVVGWTESICNDGQIEVFAASSPDGVNFSALVSVTNGGTITVPTGRYLRITVNFKRATTGETPILYDLTVGTAGYILPVLPPAPDRVCINTLADLTVSNLQQTVSGSDLTLTAHVNNGGGIAAPAGAVVTFYSGNPAQPGTVVLGTTSTTAEIVPGAFETVSLILPLGTVARPVWLVVDEANTIEELNERNNTYASTVYLTPDLVVNALDLSGLVFDIDTLAATGEIQVDIGNIGTAEAFGGYTVLLFEDRDGSGTYAETVDLLLGSALMSILQPGETVTATLPLAEGTLLSFRDSILTVIVDSDNLQVELDETNNTATTADPLQPDLTASYLREVEAADGTELTVRIGNGGRGTVPAGAEVAFYDGDPQDGGTLLDTVLTTIDLTPGVYEDVLLSLPLGSTALPVWVWVDPANTYTEPDEDNNLYETRAWVTPVPNEAPVVDAGPDRILPMPGGTITLHATASDDGWPVDDLRFRWRVVSGPGDVTFDDDTSLTPQVTVSEAGEYVLRVSADDHEYRSSDTMTLRAMTAPLCTPTTIQGFLAAPLNEAHLMGQVPVTLADEVTLTHLRIDYWPIYNPDAFRSLAENVTGSGGATIATFDTTLLANDSYVICAVGFDTTAEDWRSAAVMVTVEGENKPGRVRFSVTDLVVPVTGLPITIGRTYDSLERDLVGDFGYGWKLDLANPRVEIDAKNNVTITMPDGKRQTFYFTPYAPSPIFGFLTVPDYSPGPGVYGDLVSNGCGLLAVSGGLTFCFPGPLYAETVTEFTYTDPYGRVFVMDADGALKSIRDLNGNTLTFTPDGITSSVGGLHVPFVRDSQGRIIRITDPMGHIYRYEYNAAGDLVAVHLPDTATPVRYEYYTTPTLKHFFRSGTDPRGNMVASTTYYPDGRLETVTDALGYVTRYAYDLGTHTTTTTNPDGGVEVSVFDARGNVLSRTDPLGRVTSYTYDANNNRTSETNALGETTSYTYNEGGQRTSVTNPLDITMITVTYNQYGGPTAVEDALGHIATVDYDPTTYMPLSASDSLGMLGEFTWDSRGNPLTYRNGNGEVSSYTYDAYGNVLSETDYLGHTTNFTYDLLGHRLTTTNALDDTTTYAYDALGHLQNETDALGQATNYEYDSNYNLTAEIDPLGRRTEYEYDAANNPMRVVFPDGTSVESVYDFRGNPLTETDALGRITRYHYDLAGQLIVVTIAEGTPDEASTQYNYDAAGRQTQVIDPLGHTTTYDYDLDGRLVEVRDPLSHSITYGYDATGRPVRQTDPNGHSRTFNYDERRRLTTVVYPDGTTNQYTYDGVGQLLTYTNQANKTTQYAYDAASQLLSVTDPLEHSTHYTYDLLGRLSSITDANSHQTVFTYDALGRLEQKTWPDGTSETFTYDAVGNQLSHQLADGQVNTFVYDNLDRLAEVHYFDGQEVVYTYTSTGQRQTVTDGRGTTTYIYDSQDRVIRIVQPDGRDVAYTYDTAGNRLSLTTLAGTVAYGYDAANRLISVVDPQSNTTTYAYDAFGLLTQLHYPNGVTVDYSYDALNRLTNITQHRAGSVIGSYTYTLDPIGNRLGVVESDGNSIEWNYDDAARLLGETRYDSTGGLLTETAFTYDPVGNRLTETVDGQTTTHTYNVLDQLLTAGTAQYTYDGRGNLTQIQDGPEITAFAWDARDQLIGTTLTDGTSVSYEYDADGRRVSQNVAGQATYYLWDELSFYGDVVLETDATGAILVNYVLGNAQLISQTRSGTTSFYLHDGQGSIRALTDSAGNITDAYAYTSFGELYSQTGTTINSYLYTGQQFDTITGLYSLRNRYYSPSLGCFLKQDTFPSNLNDPSELNRYAYTANNPVNRFDPSGLFAVEYGGILSKVSVTAILVGAGIGAGTDVGFQLVFSEGTLEERWDNLNWKSVLVSGLLGAISGGFGSYAAIAGKSAYICAIGNLFIDIGLGTLMDVVFLDRDFGESLLSNTVGFGLGTAIGFVLGKLIRPLVQKVGRYAHLVDPPNVRAGNDFTPAQRRNIIQENMQRNGGVVRSDLSGEILERPLKSQSGVTPSPNEWQIDHIIPKDRGGTNSYSNAQVLSRAENRAKSNH
jgi:RHS repeat-associated protein